VPDPIPASTDRPRLPDLVEGPNLTLRLLTPDDAEALTALVVNSLDHLRPWMAWAADEPISVEARRAMLIESHTEWEAGGTAHYAAMAEGRMVGTAGLHRRQGPNVLEIGYWIDVDHLGQGHATELSRMLAQAGLEQPAIDRVEIHHEAANVASGRVAAKAGFVFAGWNRFELDGGEERLDCRWRYMTLPGFAVRAERPEDVDAIRDVVAAAFESPVEAKLVDDIRDSPRYLPDLALVAEIDEGPGHGPRVVGHVMISGCTLRSGDGAERPIVMLSPLAVHPEVQGRGIGGALVWMALGRADDRGEPLVVLEGSPAYYPRFGFEPAADHGLVIDVPDWAPPEAAQVRRLARYDPKLTGKVMYPPAFDGLD